MPNDQPRCCSRLSRLTDPGEPERVNVTRPYSWREDAVVQLWENGWSMKDVARLSGMTLAETARIIGERVRGRRKQSANAPQDDALRAKRLCQSAPDDFVAELLRRLEAGKRKRR
jgi:hypothetical protein